MGPHYLHGVVSMMSEDFKCQATAPTSGEAVSPLALQPVVGADANETHGGFLRRRALNHPESQLSRDLLIASGWVDDLNAENSKLREALEPFAAVLFAQDGGVMVETVLWRSDVMRARAALSSAPTSSEERSDTASPVAEPSPDTKSLAEKVIEAGRRPVPDWGKS
jgi:hypothetical protein